MRVRSWRAPCSQPCMASSRLALKKSWCGCRYRISATSSPRPCVRSRPVGLSFGRLTVLVDAQIVSDAKLAVNQASPSRAREAPCRSASAAASRAARTARAARSRSTEPRHSNAPRWVDRLPINRPVGVGNPGHVVCAIAHPRVIREAEKGRCPADGGTVNAFAGSLRLGITDLVSHRGLSLDDNPSRVRPVVQPWAVEIGQNLPVAPYPQGDTPPRTTDHPDLEKGAVRRPRMALRFQIRRLPGPLLYRAG